jgi:hypothetical protein
MDFDSDGTVDLVEFTHWVGTLRFTEQADRKDLARVRCPFSPWILLGLASLSFDCCTVLAFHHGFCCVRVRIVELRLMYGARF